MVLGPGPAAPNARVGRRGGGLLAIRQRKENPWNIKIKKDKYIFKLEIP
jgi:hypothetical protein